MREGDPATRMHIAEDPDGTKGMSGLWHAECARPLWDTLTPLLERMKSWGAGF